MLKYSTYWSAEQYATTTLDTGEAHSAGAPTGTFSVTYSVISGGANNGYQNYVCADYGMVANGSTNHVCGGLFASIANGLENCVTSVCGHSCYHMIAGGYLNNIIDTSLVPSPRDFNFIGTGTANAVLDTSAAFIGSGTNNCISCSGYSVIGGGNANIIIPDADGNPSCFSVIAGGDGNTIRAPFASILGGKSNTVSHSYSATFGHGIASVSPDTFHVSCINAVNTPPKSSGSFPVGTYVWKPGNTLVASDCVLVMI